MSQQTSREYQTLLVLEHFLAKLLGRLLRGLKISRLFSPWFLFWIVMGGFFFGFQSYLLIHSLAIPIANQIEIGAMIIGIVLGILTGLVVISFFPHQPTDWRVPAAIFCLWMIGPTLFPLLFLAGIFTGQEALITLQTATWRPIVEFLLFGLGIVLIGLNYQKITFTQGAVTILLFSFFFIAKVATSNAFYLAGMCPPEVLSDDRAWLSNTKAELDAYRNESKDEVFYQSPVGQLVCTRTQENLFR